MNNKQQRKDLLKKFYQSFTEYTLEQIKCSPIDRGVAYGGWFEIVFPNALDCEDLVLIGKFIKEKFFQEGLYSHLLPKTYHYRRRNFPHCPGQRSRKNFKHR
jgi:hypothetical protein